MTRNRAEENQCVSPCSQWVSVFRICFVLIRATGKQTDYPLNWMLKYQPCLCMLFYSLFILFSSFVLILIMLPCFPCFVIVLLSTRFNVNNKIFFMAESDEDVRNLLTMEIGLTAIPTDLENCSSECFHFPCVKWISSEKQKKALQVIDSRRWLIRSRYVFITCDFSFIALHSPAFSVAENFFACGSNIWVKESISRKSSPTTLRFQSLNINFLSIVSMRTKETFLFQRTYLKQTKLVA